MRRLPRGPRTLRSPRSGSSSSSCAGRALWASSNYNSTQQEHGRQPVSYVQYLTSGHFTEAVFENWESEFLQMAHSCC